MSVEAKAILIGTHHADEIAALLSCAGMGEAWVRAMAPSASEGHEILVIARESGSRRINLFTGDLCDDAEVYSSERTYLMMGAGDYAVEVMQKLAARWAGWICDNDAVGGWRFVEGDADAAVEPEVRFAVEMQELLGVKEAAIMRALLADDDRLRKFEDLLARRRADVDASASPSL